MSTTTRKGITAWVCEDCLMAENGYDTPNAEREPWSLAAEGELWTAGLPWAEHAEDCTNRATGELVDECGCESVEYSKSPCDACGSQLYGSRHGYTVWVTA